MKSRIKPSQSTKSSYIKIVKLQYKTDIVIIIQSAEYNISVANYVCLGKINFVYQTCNLSLRRYSRRNLNETLIQVYRPSIVNRTRDFLSI